MFDFRYHALSLVSVFLALMIGLLLGVAIGDRGLVSSAERNVRDSLRRDVRAARGQSADLRKQLAERRRFEEALYPLLVEGRLSGQRIGLVGLGGLPDSTIQAVRDALKDTGGRLTSVTVIREPIPGDALGGGGASGGAPDAGAVKHRGAQAGAALVRGGKAAKQVPRSLLESSSGELNGLEAVVLVRADRDENTTGEAATGAFENGLVSGLTQNDTPVVGVEETDTTPTQIRWFRDRRLTSVDDVDQLGGQAALVFGLAGAAGSFGVKDTAEAQLPKTGGASGR